MKKLPDFVCFFVVIHVRFLIRIVYANFFCSSNSIRILIQTSSLSWLDEQRFFILSLSLQFLCVEIIGNRVVCDFTAHRLRYKDLFCELKLRTNFEAIMNLKHEQMSELEQRYLSLL